MQKSIETQLSEARARAMTARIEIDTTASAPDGSVVYVTSESDARVAYAVTRDMDGNLTCSCPARVVCKHTALAMLCYDLSYHVDPMTLAAQARVKAFRFLAGYLAALETPADPMEQYHATVAAWNAAALAETEASLAARQDVPRLLAGLLLAGTWLARQALAAKWEREDQYQRARWDNFAC